MMPAFEDAARRVLDAARARGVRIATAESCTGGLVAGALTAIAGSSDVVEAGVVTYSNAAKTALLGVPADLIARHGAVSAQTARAMAQGALERTGADLSVAVTGIAGPGGGTPDKPVGLVYFATAMNGRRDPAPPRDASTTPDRAGVREASVAHGARPAAGPAGLMPDIGRIDWRRFPGSGLSRRALAAAAARQAELRHAVRVLRRRRGSPSP